MLYLYYLAAFLGEKIGINEVFKCNEIINNNLK